MESRVAPIISQLNEIVLGKHDAVWLCVLAILARGHALVEDALDGQDNPSAGIVYRVGFATKKRIHLPST